MRIHESTFAYLEPTIPQKDLMSRVRAKFNTLVTDLNELLPDGPDKTYLIRQIREAAMWANICITREADGSPRVDAR